MNIVISQTFVLTTKHTIKSEDAEDDDYLSGLADRDAECLTKLGINGASRELGLASTVIEDEQGELIFEVS